MYLMTRRTKTTAVMRAPLTELENQVMDAVWNAGPSAVETVHHAVSRNRNLKEATVRTILRRLEQKGYLRHQTQGRAYVYQAMEPSRRLAARAVKQIIDRFCRGSVEELISGIVEAKVLSNEDLEALEDSIRGHRRASVKLEER
jgi:BlaI family transcriptional regulator, penicillinase repressor